MSDDHKPVARMGLKRMSPADAVLGDPVAGRAELVRALGGEAREVLESGVVRRAAAGQSIYAAGAAADAVYLVTRGEVALLQGEGEAAIPVVTLQAGDVFGVGAVFAAAPRPLAARAERETDLVEIPSVVLRRVMSGNPAVRAALEAARKRADAAASDISDFLDRW